MTRSMMDTSVVVIGGSSGIGLETAKLASAAGAQVTIAGRDEDRLAAALESLPADARGVSLDVADESAVRELFDSFDHVDHVATLAGTHVAGTLAELDTDTLRGPVDNRFWGPLYIGKYAAPKMTTGSITLCTGAGVARPRGGNAIVTAAAGGSEFLARAMAVELAPVRVNVVRPGIVDTPLLDRLAPGSRDEVMKAMAKRVLLKRVAQPGEIADGILFLMANEYVTGTTLTIDGGASLA
ncbi:MAG TPA: SDR family oxidoreductase [Microthrixaceae bacterium]|nr:SDR family oxidoreductase [Microthrixaceae bacterium]